MANRPSSVTAVADMHAKGNRSAKDDWALYGAHRARLTAAIAAAAGDDGGTLCLLGAGNCNDVELPVLGERFAELHLVDIDTAAITRARERQAPELRRRVTLHGGVDLTGLLTRIDRWKSKPPDPAAYEQAIAPAVEEITRGLPAGRADVVVSCCLMSQLGWSLEIALGEGHPAGADLRLTMMAVHLRTLAALCRPGGMVLLVCDIVSSELYPLDELPPDTDLRKLADELIPPQQVVYAGANPVLVSRTLRRDPVLKEAFEAPTVLDPWLWTGQFERTYLVYPQRLLRRST
jgi:hypothetical protein